MKRLWIGVGTLAALLFIGIGTTLFAQRANDQISQALYQASEAVMEGRWEEAMQLSLDARAKWDANRKLTASIADHEPMEEIENLFSQMEIFLRARQQIPFAACCASLYVLTEAIGESYAINLWNLL